MIAVCCADSAVLLHIPSRTTDLPVAVGVTLRMIAVCCADSAVLLHISSPTTDLASGVRGQGSLLAVSAGADLAEGGSAGADLAGGVRGRRLSGGVQGRRRA